MAMVRRLMLFGVVLGVMSVSIHGQVSVTVPLLGFRFAVTLAVVLDVGALLALNEVLTTRRVEVRRWGWTALLLAAGLSVGLNVWHAVDSGTLPPVAAVAVGAIPVVLAGVLSHLLALSLPAETEAVPAPSVGTARVGTNAGYSAPGSVPTAAGTDPVWRADPNPAGTTVVGTAAAPRRSAGTSRAGTGGGAGAAAPRDVPQPVSVRPGSPSGARRAGQRPARHGAGGPAGGLPPAAAALWERARDLDVRHRSEHGGEGVSRRRLMSEYGIGTSTASPLLRALAAAADAAGLAGAAGTESAGTDIGAVPPAGTRTGGTGTDVTAGNAGTPADADTGTVPPAGTDGEAAVRLALVPTTAGTEPARHGTGENDDQDSTEAPAVTAGR